MARQKTFDIKDNFIENVIERPLEQVLPDSMIPYSEAVIMDRALPRVEDGLKPVQRRILYAMHDLGMKPEGAYKKSARVVGECLGKYHPHGDSSVYEAMVRMAQDFNMRMTLVDGHGNFGSIDGDSAAAMRYTEVKLAPLATELLRDIDKKGVVPTMLNFDDTLEEPELLPGRFPNLLVNGATGIAIGLSTNIPTHNLTEVIDGCIAMIDTPNIKLPDLLKIIKGPDFPSGGYMLRENFEEIYETGKGKIALRAKVDIENADGDRQNIVITEIPYGVNKKTLLETIFAQKEASKDICGNIVDVCDESDRNGMRVVVKLKKGEDAVKILNHLLKKTNLQTNFSVNMVAIAGGKPRQMGLIEILKYYIEFQRGIILRRSQYDLNVAKKREHILDGFMIIMPNIDEVIAIIRSSSTRKESGQRLRERFDLSEAQAEAILSLQLGNINKLDVTKFENELSDLKKNIEKLSKIVGTKTEQLNVVKAELAEIRDKYKVKRLTTIVDNWEDIDIKPYDPGRKTAKRCFMAVDMDGRFKVISSQKFLREPHEAESCLYEGIAKDLVRIEAEMSAIILSNKGNCYKVDTTALKDKAFNDKGDMLADIYPSAEKDEKVVKIINYIPEEVEDKEFYIYTKLGLVRKTDFANMIVNKDSYQGIVLKDNDEVIGAEFAKPNTTILFVTSDGLCVNTLTDEYPSQGRISSGVIGISVNDDASVVYAGQTIVEPEFGDDGGTVYYPIGDVAIITSQGLAKKVTARDFEPMKRNRKGLKIVDLFGLNAKVIFASQVLDDYTIVAVDDNKEMSIVNTESIRNDNRASKGKSLIRGKELTTASRHFEEAEE